ncbi:MAG: glycosyltransferase family 1 protein [Planctomycetes bacterium]|nr:glycosyltransferase family 1 protein [Planctomycetota bacterium]
MANRPIRTYTVLPHLPERLQPLHKLAHNVWWCWNQEAIALFRRIDEERLEACDNSPVRLLSAIKQERLDELLNDDGFLVHMDRVARSLDNYLTCPTWFQETYGDEATPPETLADRYRVAYFSAEFGLHESIPVYSGGLGLLAGDHLKSASDLGLPLIGVGLMYREGYFRQYLTVDGWQQERYPENDFFNLPLIPETRPDGSPVTISVPFPGREVKARIWRIQVGRVPLYLLDTNIPQNSPDDRQITSRLYGGDHDMRIRQEMILGIGGIRALRALGKDPAVCHMNEGHSAFCGLERIRVMMEEHSLDFATAREAVMAGTCFTTHTPVPAGNDMFGPQLIEHYFAAYVPQLKLDMQDLMALGRQNPKDYNEPFCMTVLALKLSNISNGVSKLHGSVSRKMWKAIWPELPEAEIPITSITNGVHIRSWLAPEITQLFERYLGIQWEEKPTDHSIWRKIDNIPNAELWRTHERRRERLVAFARARLRSQLKRRGAPPAEIARADEVLDPDALTISFARRFATYKRANLLFRNLDRLAAIINNKDRPVQIIFAGKAHPRDHGGKELITEIIHIARRPEFRRRIVFIEDYDINVARYLTQGVDVWLNNPRRPLEASGTSGMKAACNGALNLSILDGWWCEAYAGDNGWAIGAGEEYTDLAYQDEVESRAIYDMLEEEIVPTFYNRSSDGSPRNWLKAMKRCLSTICPVFNTNRMVQEYLETSYAPSAERFGKLAKDNLDKAAALAKWRRGVVRDWARIKVESVEAHGTDAMQVGGKLEVQARVNLGGLSPENVQVQLFHGVMDNQGDIPLPSTVPMSTNGSPQGHAWTFKGIIPCSASGQHGFAVRVLPYHPDLANPFEPGLVCWG